MAVDYRYYLGPWARLKAGGLDAWAAPPGCVGAVDLRPTADQARTTLGADPWGFFATPTTIPGDYLFLGKGDCRDLGPAAAVLDGWQARTGYRPAGATLADVLWDHLTNGADVAGVDTAPPLMPSGNRLELLLGGHSPIKAERFEWGSHPHTSKVQRVIWQQYRAMRSDIAAGRMRADHDRKVLDFNCEKFGLTGPADWRELVPPELRGGHPGRLPHDTSYTETFTTADSDTLGPVLSWTEIQPDIDIVSNAAERATAASGVYVAARADADVSSVDHYAEITALNISSVTNITAFAVGCRWSSSAYTAYQRYQYLLGTWTGEIVKWVAAALTILGTPSAVTAANNDIQKIQANGSTITRFLNGSSEEAITDTAITTGTRGGIHFYKDTAGGSMPRIAPFTIADLAAATTRGRPFGPRGTAFNGGRTLRGLF